MARKKREAKPDDHKCGETQFRYTPDAGTVTGPVHCGVCQTEMECTRDCNGPRSFMQAMCRSKSAYDSFECPHHEELWHIQTVQLRKLANETPSAKLAKMFRDEAKDIAKNRVATLETGSWQYRF